MAKLPTEVLVQMVLLILEEQQEDKAELIQHNIIEAQQPFQMVGLL